LPTGEPVNLATVSNWKGFLLEKSESLESAQRIFASQKCTTGWTTAFSQALAIIKVAGDLGSIERTIHLKNDDG
jgi:hypothetical protein